MFVGRFHCLERSSELPGDHLLVYASHREEASLFQKVILQRWGCEKSKALKKLRKEREKASNYHRKGPTIYSPRGLLKLRRIMFENSGNFTLKKKTLIFFLPC